MNNYYTYAYLRKDRTPYYVGKGEGNRAYKKKRGEIQPPKDKSRVIFLKKNLIEEEAFKHEKYIIAVLGRKDLGTGILRNLTDGGEGSSGAIRSQETKERISEALKGRKLSSVSLEKMRKITQSEEYRRQASERATKRYEDVEERIKISNAMKGIVFSEEHKQKLKEAALLRWKKYRDKKLN